MKELGRQKTIYWLYDGIFYEDIWELQLQLKVEVYILQKKNTGI